MSVRSLLNLTSLFSSCHSATSASIRWWNRFYTSLFGNKGIDSLSKDHNLQLSHILLSGFCRSDGAPPGAPWLLNVWSTPDRHPDEGQVFRVLLKGALISGNGFVVCTDNSETPDVSTFSACDPQSSPCVNLYDTSRHSGHVSTGTGVRKLWPGQL